MRPRIAIVLLALLIPIHGVAQSQFISATAPVEEPQYVNYMLGVYLDPSNEFIRVTSQLVLPDDFYGQRVRFNLNSNLTITDAEVDVEEVRTAAGNSAVVPTTVSESAPVTSYMLDLRRERPGESILLIYEGQINDLAEQNSPEYAQSFAATSGIISSEGVFLSKASHWIPGFSDELIQFRMSVEFADSAASWSEVTQGRYTESMGIGEPGLWSSLEPQEEAYLVAADLTVYRKDLGDTEALAYLRTPDPNLANRYLDATERYLALYEPLLGDYPYTRFALVENFWETGYGMPGFTLLGEQVIRFPFILETSYPHEILHNWWGNGVYPDYETGNWSEGLTAYLADHLFREMDGAGATYRKDMLARYKNYVAEATDFPLSDFTARNSAASQAVGYGKTLMMWHMLRRELGDELFLEGLRKLYEDFKFQRASFDDIEQLYSALSGTDLSAFFAQWVTRTGAPELSINVEEVNGNRVRIMFAQTQFGEPYELTVPVALYYEGESQPQIYEVNLNQKLQGVMADNYDRLQGVLVDPYFDVFRQLDRAETPPTVGEMFGASKLTFVLPLSDRESWRQLAQAFAAGTDATIIHAEDLESLPHDQSVWLLGRDNPFMTQVMDMVADFGATFTAESITLAQNDYPYRDRSTVLIGRHPADPELALGWIHIDDPVAVSGMIEKLPHYGRYSYLSFTGAEPTNDLSGVWVSNDSPMQWANPSITANIAWNSLPAVSPLAELPPRYSPARLLSHVDALAASELQGRGAGTRGSEATALYITDQFRAAGLRPLSGTYQQRWRQVLPGKGAVELSNVIGVIPGSNRRLNTQPVIVGAHYDHLGVDPATGQVYPGADDNASGVSVMLEVAKQLSSSFAPQRPVFFVAFAAEEEGLIGSEYFVANPPAGFSADEYYAMVNLDAVGRLQGKNLQVFGTESAYEWPFMAQGIGFTIGLRSDFPAETIASSDHVSFLNAGVPAIHLFTGAHADYHRVSDIPARIDEQGMSSIALWLEEAIVYLADNTAPLRSNQTDSAPIQSGNTSGREVSLGTIPDFAYSGEGVRVSAVVPGSAAEAAGLQEGDILLLYNEQPMTDLQTYSNLLRSSSPGDRVVLELMRGDSQISLEAVLGER